MKGADQIVRLELHRIRVTFSLLIGAYVIALTAALVSSILFRDLFISFFYIYPFLSGILFSVGIAADDNSQSTLVTLLSLPISRNSLWLYRAGIRFALFLLSLCAWYIPISGIPLIYNSGVIEQLYECDSMHLAMIGLIAFSSGLLTSCLFRTSFEAAIAAAATGLGIIVMIRQLGQMELITLNYFAVSLIIGVVAWRHFSVREPLHWQALKVRTGISAAIILTAIFILSILC